MPLPFPSYRVFIRTHRFLYSPESSLKISPSPLPLTLASSSSFPPHLHSTHVGRYPRQHMQSHLLVYPKQSSSVEHRRPLPIPRIFNRSFSPEFGAFTVDALPIQFHVFPLTSLICGGTAIAQARSSSVLPPCVPVHPPSAWRPSSRLRYTVQAFLKEQSGGDSPSGKTSIGQRNLIICLHGGQQPNHHIKNQIWQAKIVLEKWMSHASR